MPEAPERFLDEGLIVEIEDANEVAQEIRVGQKFDSDVHVFVAYVSDQDDELPKDDFCILLVHQTETVLQEVVEGVYLGFDVVG